MRREKGRAEEEGGNGAGIERKRRAHRRRVEATTTGGRSGARPSVRAAGQAALRRRRGEWRGRNGESGGGLFRVRVVMTYLPTTI